MLKVLHHCAQEIKRLETQRFCRLLKLRDFKGMYKTRKRKLLSGINLILCSWLILYLFFVSYTALAEVPNRDSVKSKHRVMASMRISPRNLPGGSQVLMISPYKWKPLADEFVRLVERLHERYKKMFGDIPPFQTTVRLMDKEAFYRETGAPAWTNAMYFKGKITIPLDAGGKIDLDDLYRSIKHEFSHAIIHSLSGGRCPGWLDEGLAQIAEGSVNPSVLPALKNWVYLNNAILPFSLLQGGFTKLESSMVAPAYGQSLLAAEELVRRFGTLKIGNFLRMLRNSFSQEGAFIRAFGLSLKRFERELNSKLITWAYENKSLRGYQLVNF